MTAPKREPKFPPLTAPARDAIIAAFGQMPRPPAVAAVDRLPAREPLREAA